MRRFAVSFLVLALGSAACGESGPSVEAPAWQIVHEELPGALMSVWGTSSTDVWLAGADPGDGKGPLVLHFDGEAWTRKNTGATGDLWWIMGFEGGPVFLGGEDGLILRYSAGQFEQLDTPGTGTVFGLWGAAADDMWAVGGYIGGASGAFAWRYSGDVFVEAEGFPAELSDTHTVWKIHGRSADDIWLVGTNGLTMHYDGAAFEQVPSGTTRSLFTVHGNSQLMVAVGGYGTGTVIENDGSGWVDVSTPSLVQMVGVRLTEDAAYSVGIDGAVYRRTGEGWQPEATKLAVYEQFHAVWTDPEGGVWAVGGQTLSEPLIRGVLIYKGITEIAGGSYVEE
jgi:hypothetical protein